ncbi:MAG: hypothetical protein ABI629_09475 [bacterium]
MVDMRRFYPLGKVTGRLLAAGVFALTAARLQAAEEPAPPEEPAREDILGTPETNEEAPGPNQGRVSFSFNSDFTTAYVFRGIVLERDGFIWQPSADIALKVYEGDGFLKTASLNFGIWNSVQSEHTDARGTGPSNLYETDYYPGFTLGWSPGIETSLTYTIYTSPNGAFSTVQQLDLGLAYDDSELLGPFAFSPTATFSFELENTSFGNKKGDYFELTGEPGIDLSLPFDPDGNYPITASLPLALGLSMNDYYEDGTHNQTFGFFSFGVGLSMPLSFIPKDLGAWSVGTAINVYCLSQTLKQVAENDNPFPVGTASISMEY